MYTWRTDPNGSIVVSDDGGPEFIPTLSGALVARCEAGIARWADKFRAWGLGVRVEWLIAMALQESNFNPRAVNPERSPGPEDDGVGLFQITNRALKGHYTDEQLKDPQTNTQIAARYVLDLGRRYGDDFVRVAAAYNAGSARPPAKGFENKWNLHCWHGHLDVEVPAMNYAIARGLEAGQRADEALHAEAERAFARRFGPLDLIPNRSAIETDEQAPPSEAPPETDDA